MQAYFCCVLNRFRHSMLIQVFCGLMGIYLLNISVDSADLNPNYVSEDLSINDQESIVEIILEQILGFEDAIAEYDDNDFEEHNKKNTVKLELIAQANKDLKAISNYNESLDKLYMHSDASLRSGHGQLDTPPPRICFVLHLPNRI